MIPLLAAGRRCARMTQTQRSLSPWSRFCWSSLQQSTATKALSFNSNRRGKEIDDFQMQLGVVVIVILFFGGVILMIQLIMVRKLSQEPLHVRTHAQQTHTHNIATCNIHTCMSPRNNFRHRASTTENKPDKLLVYTEKTTNKNRFEVWAVCSKCKDVLKTHKATAPPFPSLLAYLCFLKQADKALRVGKRTAHNHDRVAGSRIQVACCPRCHNVDFWLQIQIDRAVNASKPIIAHAYTCKADKG